jgi:rod shape-determining protein MreD
MPAPETPGIGPPLTLGRRLDIAARHAFPAGSTVLLMLLAGAPFGIAGQAALLPAVTLSSVYCWSLLRPGAMPPPVVFLIGILLDLLGYLPLGAGPLTLLTLHGVALRWRHRLASLGFGVGWLIFALFAVSASALCWMLAAVLSFRLLPMAPALFEAALAIALYPALGMLFLRAHRGLAEPERA